MAADPNAPYGYRTRDSDNDILRKILNWFNALGARTRSIAVTVVPTPSDAVTATVTAFSKTVAATGTPERLAAAAGTYVGQQIVVVPLVGNTGEVYLDPVGTDGVQSVEAPFIFGAPDGKQLDAYDIFADVTVNGEGVRVIVIN